MHLLEKTNVDESLKIKVFPNPAATFINISFNLRAGEKTIRLDVLDVNGKRVPVMIPAINLVAYMSFKSILKI